MSRKKSSKQKKIQTAPDRTDYLAALPLLLMCLITLCMTVADVLSPEMSEHQYALYPAMFRAVHFVIVPAGIVYWIILLRCGERPWQDQKFLSICFGIFFLLIIASTIVNGPDEKTIHGVSYRNIGIFHLFAFIAIYMLLSSRISRTSLRDKLIMLFIGTGDLLAISVFIDKFLHQIPAYGAKKDLSAIFFNGNHYGYFLVMVILASFGAFLWYKERKVCIFALVSFVLNLAVLMMNGSTGCLLAVLCTLIITAILVLVLWRDSLGRLAVAAGIGGLLALCGILLVPGFRLGFGELIEDVQLILSSSDAGTAGHNRWLLWETTLGYVLDQPMLGYGCEGLRDALMSATGRANPHNELLHIAGQFGIPACISYCLGVLALLVRGFTCKDSDPSCRAALLAATGYFISSFFGVPMFYTLPFFFIFLGMAQGTKK